MDTVLFVIFLAVFAATAVITLLGLIGKVTIKEGYLKGLYAALILEVVGVMIGVAKEANFIGDPYGDLMARLPPEIKGETSDKVIDNIQALTERPVECVDCSAKLQKYIKEFPGTMQRSTLDDSFAALHSYIGTFANEQKEQVNNCTKPDTGLLSKFMVLRDDIRKYGSVNFLWNKEEKENIAFRVLEILGELGYYKSKAEPNPDAAHKAVEEYQKHKNIRPKDGRFGRKTYLQLFNDFITLE